MSDSPIRDIPRIKKMLEDAKNMKALKTISPLMLPLLRPFGVDVNQIREALGPVESLTVWLRNWRLFQIASNDLFAKRGWIMYDLMNLEAAKAAILKAESGDMDGAEADLVNYYSAETVEWKLRTMIGVEAFRARMPLAEKAFIDYQEERYHAVPRN